jgi:hypothetical protein
MKRELSVSTQKWYSHFLHQPFLARGRAGGCMEINTVIHIPHGVIPIVFDPTGTNALSMEACVWLPRKFIIQLLDSIILD